MSQPIETLGLDEAMAVTLEYLRDVASRPHGQRGMYGYDLWAPAVANAWAAQVCGTDTFRRENIARRASPVFFEAAWELCRRGVIRPGIRETGAQAVAGGCGYSLTIQGREALVAGNADRFVALQPGALAAAFAKFKDRFGEGYHQRCQEAIRCRDSEAWVAAMAMIGAAAESIILATATAKIGNKDTVLKAYSSATGRKKLFNDIAPVGKPHLARPLSIATGLLVYWRDEASHNAATAITGPEVEQALRELLHLVQFVGDNWDELTSTAKAPSKAAASTQMQTNPQTNKNDEKSPSPQVKPVQEPSKTVAPTSSLNPTQARPEPCKTDAQISTSTQPKPEAGKVEAPVKPEPFKMGFGTPSSAQSTVVPTIKTLSALSTVSTPGNMPSSLAPVVKPATMPVSPTSVPPIPAKPEMGKVHTEQTSASIPPKVSPEVAKTDAPTATPTVTPGPETVKPPVTLPAATSAPAIGGIRPPLAAPVGPAPISGATPLAACATPSIPLKPEPAISLKSESGKPDAPASVLTPSPATTAPLSNQTTSSVTPITAGIKSLMSWARSPSTPTIVKPEPGKIDAQTTPSVPAQGKPELGKIDAPRESGNPAPIGIVPEKISNHGG
jgi:hypothetical protein